jgi:hypothetical protein
MLTIKNFEKKLKEFIPNTGFRLWYIEDILVYEDFYTIVLQKNSTKEPDYCEVRLRREHDENMSRLFGDVTYKLSFRLMGNTKPTYEHWVSHKWLTKPPLDFMNSIGDIIESFVVNAPKYTHLPF